VSKASISRIFKNLGVNAFGQIAGTAIQLASVPIFLKAWGIELYGEWITLSAIPTYLSMSDVGFGSVAANEMTMLVAKNDRSTALQVFHSTLLLLIGTSCLAISVGISLAWIAPWEQWLNIAHQSHRETATILSLLMLYALASLQGNFLMAGFRCEGRYATGTLIMIIIRIIECAIALMAAYIGATPTMVALAFLTVRVLGYGWLYVALHKASPWITLSFKLAKFSTVKRLARPAIAFLGLPLGNALNNQGIITVISITLGSRATAIFSTLRTLSRFVFQLINGINNAVWPELSAAYGSGNLQLAKAIHRRACQVSLWVSFVGVTGLSLTGGWILDLWTHGQVSTEGHLFAVLLLVIFVNSLWYASSVALIATNNHQKMVARYLIGTVLSLPIAIVMMRSIGLNGAGISILMTDILMTSYVLSASLKLLKDNLSSFLVGMFSIPKLKF
jgi:O-antigen/teichoic acid export membrane protein